MFFLIASHLITQKLFPQKLSLAFSTLLNMFCDFYYPNSTQDVFYSIVHTYIPNCNLYAQHSVPCSVHTFDGGVLSPYPEVCIFQEIILSLLVFQLFLSVLTHEPVSVSSARNKVLTKLYSVFLEPFTLKPCTVIGRAILKFPYSLNCYATQFVCKFKSFPS